MRKSNRQNLRVNYVACMMVASGCVALVPTVNAAPTNSQMASLRLAVERADNAQQRVSALWNLADAHLQQGRVVEAERLLRDAASTSSDGTTKAGSALRLGVVFTAGGQVQEARQQLDSAQAQSAALSAQDKLELPQALGALAVRSGDWTTAERHFEQAAVESKSASSASGEARGRINALRARLDRKEIAGLEQRLGEINTLVLNLPRGEQTASLLLAGGELYRRAVNEFRSAIALRSPAYDLFARALDYAETGNTRAFAYGLLGALYEDELRWDEALNLTSQAVFLAQSVDAQDQVYRWEWQLGRIQGQRGDLTASADSLNRALTTLTPIRSDVLDSSRQAYGAQVEPVYLEYADANLRRASALKDGTPEHQRLLRNVRDQLESLKQAEVQDYFESQCAATDTKGAGGGFNVPGAAVVYPILLANRIEVLVETGGVLKRFSSNVSKGDATAAARRMRLGLEQTAARDAYLQPAQSLYRWLLAEADAWLVANKVSTLVFVPTGPLRTIPFGALHDGQRFLIERYALTTTPALSLVSDRNALDSRRLFIGGLTKSVQGFSELPSVSAEMKSVSALFPSESLKDESFQLKSVETQLSTPAFSVAHLATHGEFSSDYKQSFVLTYDKRLTMDALKVALGLRDKPLDLLVLSACRTAAGDDRAALGLAGVAVQAGAKSALASLWYISDQATAELMGKFYQHLQTGKSSKAESLRQAQISLLQSPQFRHPSFWAPYLLIGNWL